MVGSSKILTVSYGTFSCTLEGFDDPFSTMKSIAEYFRDLAADDRYFGAEPPTPDAEMLHAIAEREVKRRVETRVDTDGIVLRQVAQGDDAAQVAEAPAPVAPEPVVEPEPIAAAAPEVAPDEADADDDASVSAKLSRIRAVVAKSRDDGNAAELAEDVYETPLDDAFFTGDISSAFQDVAPEDEIAQIADVAAEPAETSEPIEDSEEADVDSDEIAAISAALDATYASDDADADDEPPVDTFEPEEDVAEENIPAPDMAAETVADALDDAPEEPAARTDNVPDTSDIKARIIRLKQSLTGAVAAEPVQDDTAEIAEEPLADGDITDEDAHDLAMLDGVADADAAVEDTDADAEEPFVADMPDEIDLDIEPAAEVEDHAEEATAAPDPLDAVAQFDDAADIDDDPAAEFEAEVDDAENAFDDDVGDHPRTAEDEEVLAALERIAQESAELTAEQEAQENAFAEPEAEAYHEDDADEALEPDEEGAAAFDRILEETNSKLEDDEGSRRRSAIAHLKAAVAATKADRLAKTGKEREAEDAAEQNPYRDDLAKVVRPRRPEEKGQQASSRERPQPIEERPAPLMLVSEQRVDTDDAPGTSIKPRRVNTEILHAEAEAAVSGDMSFPDFAEKMGATELPDLLEAAAAYSAFVEGQTHFSRPQLMRRVASFERENYTREAGLRSFGQLLRQGKIQKLKRGQFTITPESRFNPEARLAGE